MPYCKVANELCMKLCCLLLFRPAHTQLLLLADVAAKVFTMQHSIGICLLGLYNLTQGCDACDG